MERAATRNEGTPSKKELRRLESNRAVMSRLLSVALLLALGGVALATAHQPHGGLDASAAGAGILLTVDANALRSGVQSCASVASDTAFDIAVVAEGVEDLGGFQFDLRYDAAVVNVAARATVDGGLFLGSAGGADVLNLSDGAPDTDGRYTTAAVDLNKTGPDGSGVLAIEHLQAVGSGSAMLVLEDLRLADVSNPPNALAIGTVNGAEVRSDGSPCEAGSPPWTSTPVTPVVPTATPAHAPPAPTPTAAVTPVAEARGGVDVVYLMPGCNAVASTFPNDTPVETVAGAVAPADVLASIWEFDGGAWLGFDGQLAEVSDLREADHLQVVFLCVTSGGTFARPLV